MSRASQFINFINTQNLKEHEPVNMWYRQYLTGFEVTEHLKKVRKDYLKAIKNPSEYK